MVRLRLLTAGFVLAALACSGGGASSPAPARTAGPPRPATAPTASIEPRSGPPGSEVTVTGAGWPPGIQVELTGRVPPGVPARPYATVLTDGTGSFTAYFRLEKTPDGRELQVGRFELIARSPVAEVTVPFQVETRRPLGGPGPG